MTALLIFVSTFILVFALGFQSLNVNNGHYKAAFFTSFAIAVSNLVLFKTVPQAGVLEIAAYLLSGPFAIVCSMLAHDKWMKAKPSRAPNFMADCTCSTCHDCIDKLYPIGRAEDEHGRF